MSTHSFVEYVALWDGLLAPDRPPVKGMTRINTSPMTTDERLRLRPNLVSPPAPVGRARQVVPTKLVSNTQRPVRPHW